MATYFRKSKKVGPFRLTASKRGLSASAGVPGFRVSANSRGQVRRTISAPGTGLYNVKRIDSGAASRQAAAAPRLQPAERTELDQAKADLRGTWALLSPWRKAFVLTMIAVPVMILLSMCS